MSEDKKPFTVSDRRHFTSEGEVRKSDADETAPDAPPVPEAGAAAAPPSVPSATGAPEAAGEAGAVREGADAGGDQTAGSAGEAEDPGGRFPHDLLGLLISLGAQASMLLMGGPEGEAPDLESARALIELLSDLKTKTEGRRTPQEDQLLDGLLYELRMAYVQATRAAR